jgi:hypothetical protein
MSLPKPRTSRFNSRCKICGKEIRVGDTILWSKASGNVCLDHGSPDPKPDTRAAGTDFPATTRPVQTDLPSAPKPENNHYEWTIDWADLKQLARETFEGKVPAMNRANAQNFESMLVKPRESWNGFTRGELQRWVTEGFETEILTGMTEFTPPLREKRRLRFVEEGDEFQADLAMAGDENFMTEWTKREVIPGVSLDCVVTFSAFVSPQVVNAYNAWICQTVYSLEMAGIDCEVTLTNSAIGTFREAPEGHVCDTRVKVKKENEITDFHSFSAMISPAAMRGFLFAAKSLHAESRGMTVTSGLGRPNSKAFDVKYDPDTRRIVVTCEGGASSFPREEMTTKFHAALRDAMRG